MQLMCAGGSVVTSLLTLSIFVNLLQVVWRFRGSALNKLKGVARMEIHSLRSIAGKYSGGNGYSTELTDLASLLQKCFNNIPEDQVTKLPPNEIDLLKKSWIKLHKVAGKMEGRFAGAWLMTKVMNPSMKKNKHKEMHVRVAIGVGDLVRVAVMEVFTNLENMLQDLMVNTVTTEALGDNKKDGNWKKCKGSMQAMLSRLKGIVGAKLRGVAKEILSHPGSVPVLRQIVMDNVQRIIRNRTKYAWLVSLADRVSLINKKEKARLFTDTIIKQCLNEIRKIIEYKSHAYMKEGKAAQNQHLPRKEFYGPELSEFAVVKGSKQLQKAMEKRQAAASSKAADPLVITDPETQALLDEALGSLKSLEQRLFMWQVITSFLVLIILINWCYIIYSCLDRSSAPPRGKKKPSVRISGKKPAVEVEHRDLELGEGRSSEDSVVPSRSPNRSKRSGRSGRSVRGVRRSKRKSKRRSYRPKGSKRSDKWDKVKKLSEGCEAFNKSQKEYEGQFALIKNGFQRERANTEHELT